MTTLITRDQMRPGQIVQRVTTQTYRVRSARWSDDNASERVGLCKLDPLRPSRVEWQLVRDRLMVYQSRASGHLPGRHDGLVRVNRGDWLVHAVIGTGYEVFATWAEAIAYADRMARQAGTEVAP